MADGGVMEEGSPGGGALPVPEVEPVYEAIDEPSYGAEPAFDAEPAYESEPEPAYGAGAVDGVTGADGAGHSNGSNGYGTAPMREDAGTLEGLKAVLLEIGPIAVAFSGGADSAFLAFMASQALGPERALCVTAVSPSLADEELADCRELATEWRLRLLEVPTDELANPAYAANDGSRCYYCKSSLMDAVEEVCRQERGDWTVALGVNLDDLGDHRPGQQAAAERGARFPLVEAGFTKDAVRSWSRQLGLRTWDKPAAACLASRVPYGTPVTLGTLTSVGRAESALHSLGFRQVRVRHYGDTARIEVPPEELTEMLERRDSVVPLIHEAGYRYVTLDLEGFRSGNLNASLGEGELAPSSEPVP